MRVPGASRSSDEVVPKTSGRHAGGGYLTVEFGSDGAGVMLEDVIGVPFVGQLVEGIIIDIPGQESKSGKSHQRHGRDR